MDEKKYLEMLQSKIASSNKNVSNESDEDLFSSTYLKKWSTNW